jgi:hypothetical protein
VPVWPIVFLSVTTAVFAQSQPPPAREADSRLTQDAYIWQREWNPAVRSAILAATNSFNTFCFLAAEVQVYNQQPRVVFVPGAFEDCAGVPNPMAAVIRVGPYPGPFSPTAPLTQLLRQLARSVAEAAATNGLTLTELQVDFDCAQSKLAGYRVWVEILKSAVAPLPVTITVLPCWLGEPDFAPLVEAAGSYVLQVHSLERPRSITQSFLLCDPHAARQAVRQAATYPVPFRVALPTYGYRLHFSEQGSFIGISSEPGRTTPPPRTRTVRSDPSTVAGLVYEWSRMPPANMKGLIWYRLPVEGDSLNWSLPMLRTVMQGRVPHAALRTEVVSPSPGLYEVRLVNSGQRDLDLLDDVRVEWSEARCLSADSQEGFLLMEPVFVSPLHFRATASAPVIPAGSSRRVGWIRLDSPKEVTARVETP